MAQETVTLDKDVYNDLVAAQKFLNALYAAGVDNWSGYGEAQDIMDTEEDCP